MSLKSRGKDNIPIARRKLLFSRVKVVHLFQFTRQTCIHCYIYNITLFTFYYFFILIMGNDFYYSPRYEDDEYEYRHVHVTKEVARLVPKNRLMSEKEWRELGIQQSPGWIHYMIHGPERHVLLFRRPKTNTSGQRQGMTNNAALGVHG